MRLPISDLTDILSRTVSELSPLTVQIFAPPPPWGLETTYDVHLGLMRVVDFLLMLIALFSLDVTAEALRAKIDRKLAITLQCGHFDPKFQVEGVAPTYYFCTDS